MYNSTMYPQSIERLVEAKQRREFASNARAAVQMPLPPGGEEPWPPHKAVSTRLQIPDPTTSSYMHMRHTGAIPSRRASREPPVRYEDQIHSKVNFGHRNLQENVWEEAKPPTHAKPVLLRPGCQKGELYPAQREIQRKLLSRYPNIIEAFRALDGDRSGTLTRLELMKMFKTLGIQIRQPTLDTLLDIVDTDESGALNYKEFAQVLTTDSVGLERMLSGSSQ